MRAEKQYLISEVDTHLKKSDYVILTNFSKVTVAEPEMHVSVAVIRTFPPAEGNGERTPASMAPGGVSSSRVADHSSFFGSIGTDVPLLIVPVAVNVIGPAEAPSSLTTESAGERAID